MYDKLRREYSDQYEYIFMRFDVKVFLIYGNVVYVKLYFLFIRNPGNLTGCCIHF